MSTPPRPGGPNQQDEAPPSGRQAAPSRDKPAERSDERQTERPTERPPAERSDAERPGPGRPGPGRPAVPPGQPPRRSSPGQNPSGQNPPAQKPPAQNPVGENRPPQKPPARNAPAPAQQPPGRGQRPQQGGPQQGGPQQGGRQQGGPQQGGPPPTRQHPGPAQPPARPQPGPGKPGQGTPGQPAPNQPPPRPNPPQRPAQPAPTQGQPWRGGPPPAMPRRPPPQQPAKQPAAPASPVRPPEQQPRPPAPSAPPERPDPGRLVGTIAPGDSTAKRVWQVASRVFGSNRDTRELPELVTATQLPVTTGRRIAITSVCGGAGKSAVAAMLGIVYAARRADAVLAADADPDGGSLAWRLGLSGTTTMSELAPRLLAARGGELTDLERLLPRTRTGLWVIPGGAPDQPRLARDVTRALSRLFAVCVTDCGRGMDSPATVQVLSEAHAVVVVAPATPDGVRTTCDALDRVAGTDRASSLSRVVVALTAHTAEGGKALRGSAAREAFARYEVPLVMVPYDRHLAAAAAITPSQIGQATLVEATRLAGQALARAGPL